MCAALSIMAMVPSGCDKEAPQPVATDGPEAFDGEVRETARQYQNERYDELERRLTQYAMLSERFDDGRFKLHALQEFFDNFGGWADVRSAREYARIQRWRSARPRSIAAVLAEVGYWRAYAATAWERTATSTLSPAECKLLKERLHRAEALLAQSETFASKNPLWWVETLQVAQDLDEPPDAVKEIWRRGNQAFPDYFPLHFTMLQSFDPRVGGSLAAQAAFIDEVSDRASVSEREMLYARMWWTVARTDAPGIDVFARGGVSWVRMKAGFEQLAVSWPKSDWNASSYAYFACRAGDGPTYRKLRVALGGHLRWDAFSSFYSTDFCNALVG